MCANIFVHSMIKLVLVVVVVVTKSAPVAVRKIVASLRPKFFGMRFGLRDKSVCVFVCSIKDKVYGVYDVQNVRMT